jgi:hypothetical protein
MFRGVFVNNRSFLNTFFVRKLIMRNPMNILTGAGAMDTKKGIRIIDP